MKNLSALIISLLFVSMSYAQEKSKDYSGAIGAGNYCANCSFENRSDIPRVNRGRRGANRFLVSSDQASVDRRCQELGWDYGQVLQTYSYQEWCRYGNARTRSWDQYENRWFFGRCENGNVKQARCFQDGRRPDRDRRDRRGRRRGGRRGGGRG